LKKYVNIFNSKTPREINYHVLSRLASSTNLKQRVKEKVHTQRITFASPFPAKKANIVKTNIPRARNAVL